MSNPDKTASPLPRPRATVAMAFVQGLLAGITARGGDPGPILAAVGIDAGLLHLEHQRVPVQRYAALYNRLIAELQDEGFGLFSTPLPPGTFEFLCRSIIAAPTLGEALERATRFLGLLLHDLSVHLETPPGSQALLRIREGRPLPVGRVFAFEWLLRLLHGLASWLAGRSIVLERVDFPYPRPAHGDDYALIYTAHSVFGADSLTARFSATLLDLPIRRDEAALAGFLQGAPGRITTLYRRDREMVLRVRDLLRDSLPEPLDLEGAAQRLNLSPRTLHRRLEEEGSGFRAIKDALRRDLALARLAKTGQPLGRIAADLGFADPSAFFRAFVAWTGTSPSQYRKRLRAQGSSPLPPKPPQA